MDNERKPLTKGPKAAVLCVSIIMGVLFCVLQTGMINILFTIIGVILALGGILAIISRRFIGGVILAALGGLIIASAWIPNWTKVAYIIFGVMLLISGIFGFITAVYNENARSCISAVFSAVLGGFLIGFKEGADWMFFVVGALFILLGVVGLILLFVPSKKDVKTVDVKPIDEEGK
ncbi:MAG: hypothetical protein KBS97_01470 [Firmicutes bacterium]|nr:hypothetical protein [Candidatus Fiminaster equi]